MSKKKILILNYEFPPLGGGASPVSYEIAKGYVKLGHKVDVITMHYKGLPKEEIKEGIRIFRVPCLRSKKEICHPWEQLTYIISAKKFLKQHIRQNQYDICHTHFIIPTGLVAIWLKQNYNLEYIITSHGSDVPGYNTDRFKLLHKFTGPMLSKVCNGAKYIISPSQYLADLIKKNINQSSPIKIIPNGIDIKQFTYKPQRKKKIILSTGRLLERKGFQYLIQAVSKKDFGYEVHIAGDGPMMQELKALAHKSETKIILHGWLDNKSPKYKDLLESASIYVLASEKENASVSLLEAMSAGCAVITTNVSGCPETVGEAGITIDPKSSQQIYQALQKIQTNLPHYANKARKRIESEYNWDKNIKQYIKALV